MVENFLLDKILTLVTVSVSLLLGVWIFFTDIKNKSNKLFLLISIFSSVWIICSSLLSFFSLQDYQALLIYRINFGVVLLLAITSYFFSQCFPRKYKEYPIFNKIYLYVGIFFYFVTLFTSLVIKDIKFEDWGINAVLGKGISIYYCFAVFSLFWVSIQFFNKYLKSSREEKIKIRYFLLGVFLFVLTNIIFNILLPWIQNTYRYYRFGDYSIPLFLGFTAYAIIKKELFGPRVVLTAIFVSVIAILLAVDMFVFTPDLLLKLYKLLILVVFIYFGYTLIKSVLREIEWRERVDKAYEIEKKAREGLQQLDEAKNQFIMASQHHLRSPLSSMRGFVDLIMTGSYGKVPEKLKDPILKFQISTSRLIRIVNEFLDISQFQLGKKVVVTKPGVEVEPIMREIVEELQYEAQVKKLYLTFEKSTENIPLIEADREKLKVALANIIDNAIKYTSSGGITIKTQITGKKLQIIIKDTGIGLTEEERETLFSRLFERGVEARKVFATGRGIGLFITNKIIEAHNGRIWVESEGKGKGSEFHIELPMG